jgi:hypothetical protein
MNSIKSLFTLSLLCLLFLPLQGKKERPPASVKIGKEELTIANKSQWPLLVYPIPYNEPARLLAQVPNAQPGMITTPAYLSWPENTGLLMLTAAIHQDPFEKALNETINDYYKKQKPTYYNWATQMGIRLHDNIPPNEFIAITLPKKDPKVANDSWRMTAILTQENPPEIIWEI